MEELRLHRGDVVRVDLDPIVGSEQSGERPAVIISPDAVNEHSPVVIVAAITSKKTQRVYALEAAIEPPEGGLKVRSKAMLLQIRSVDKRRISFVYGQLSRPTMAQVDSALKLAVGLMST